ncbi:hypothetical protein LZ30DRAFT_700031 [Colletotrichum cereale]|nr:hypothetical protein LZ30DRAFT_700031 [Colletotrichum cereale]
MSSQTHRLETDAALKASVHNHTPRYVNHDLKALVYVAAGFFSDIAKPTALATLRPSGHVVASTPPFSISR